METIFDTLKFYYYYYESQFMGAPFLIRIASAIIIFLAIIYISTLIRFFFFIYINRRSQNRLNYIAGEYKDKLKHIMFSSDNLSGEEIKAELRVENKKMQSWKKKEITNLILSLKPKDIDIQFNEENYSKILDTFSLVPFWEAKLKIRNLSNNKKALRILENLGRNIPGSSFSSRIEEHDPDLRKHVKSGFIHYASYDNFKFLDDDFDNQFNSLDEMRIHAALTVQAKKRQLPPLIRWVISSKNAAYRAFLIEEIGLFKQQECAPKLLELFKTSRNNKVKEKIVETLGMLKYTKALSVFMTEYESCAEKVQTAIVSVVGDFGTPEALQFLKEVYDGTSNNGLTIKIVQNIYKLDHEKATFSYLKQNASGLFNKSVFEFVEQQ